jgi:UPF0716 protein FxsA
MKPILLLLAYPLSEIAAFVLVGGWIGLLPTLALVILSAVSGVMIMRHQARMAGQNLRSSLGSIRGPVNTLADGALIMLGAILLIVPGFLSDLAALPLLIAPLRKGIIVLLASRAKIVTAGARTRHSSAETTIIDGTFYEVDPDANPRSPIDPPSGWTRH